MGNAKKIKAKIIQYIEETFPDRVGISEDRGYEGMIALRVEIYGD
jgi:hypothetical protein